MNEEQKVEQKPEPTSPPSSAQPLDAAGFPPPSGITMDEIEAAREQQKAPWAATVEGSGGALPLPVVIGAPPVEATPAAPTPATIKWPSWADLRAKSTKKVSQPAEESPAAVNQNIDPGTGLPMRPSEAHLPPRPLPKAEDYTTPREPAFMSIDDSAWICEGKGDPSKWCKYYFKRSLPFESANASQVTIIIERYCLRLMPVDTLQMEDRAAVDCTEYEPRE